VLLLAGTAVLAFSSGAAGSAQPSSGLCGIAEPVDDILHCREAPPPSESPPPTPPNNPPASVPEAGPKPSPSVSSASAPDTHPALSTIAPYVASPMPDYVPNLLLVRFKPGLSPRRRAQALAAAGAVVDHEIGQLGVFVLRVLPARRDQVLARLQASSLVAGAEKDEIVEELDTTPNDTDWSDQWGLQRIGLPSAWDQTKGANVTVAVLDTGVDAAHPDLQGAVLPGYDLTGSPAGTDDSKGHGSAVAGIIAARTNNHQGVAGICWSCSILPVKVLADDGEGSVDDVAQGIVKATDAGARVINLSLGGPAGSDTLDQAISYAVAKNVVLVAAAGNNGSSAPFYPAANPNVVSVAATDETDRLYSWSDFGSWVRVSAPGCNPAPALAGNYAIFCGTSAAAPVVSGLIALAFSLRPDADQAQVVQAVTSGTDPLSALPQGRIDAPATLSAIAPGTALPARPRGTKSTFRGVLTATQTWHVHERVVGMGTATETVSFTRSAWVTLSLVTSSNKVLARISGHTPLTLRHRLPAGAYWFGVAVAGRATTRYTLTVVAPP
jgi:subtilisin family serine protease